MSAPLDRFAAVVESSDDTIVTTTPNGTITSWNRAATQLFGYDPAEAIGRPITILFPRERLGEEAELRPRGQVLIETGPHPDRSGWMRLVVADTGDGMGPEGLAKLWEPFYTTKASGTGLGLSVSHKIIREHGGVVDVLSAPGRGTTFNIHFPLHTHA